jgi:OOP family OmpA-OmpF porin
MKVNKQLAALAAALSAVSGAAVAAGNDSGAYLGGGVGYSHHAGECPAGTDCSRSDAGFKIFGGYQFNPYVALEAGYIDLGKAKASNSRGELSAATTSFTTAVLGMVPLGTQASLFGKLGMHWSKTKISGSAGGLSDDYTDNHNGFLAGIGGQYNFTPNFVGRLEYEWLNKADKAANVWDGDVHLLSASLIYKF